MKRITFSICLSLLLCLSVSAPCLGAILNVRAFVDGRSQLMIQGNHIWWHHIEWSAPGWNGNGYEPMYLNSTAWTPTWPSPGDNSFCYCDSSVYTNLSPALATDGVAIQVTEIDARDPVSIIQQPSGANGYTAIIEFDDDYGGAYWYEINLTYNSSVSSSIPTLSEWGMIFMSLMLAGSALWMIRRRKVS